MFLKAFRTIDTFEGDSERFRAWLFTIAHHAAIDDARRRMRRIEETLLDRAHEPVGGDVENDALGRLANDRVEAMLAHLSPDQRDVIMLRIVADVSIVHAWKGDHEGNLVYRKTARNFNPMMATAGKVTISEVEHLVETGTFDPDQIHTPGIFVDRIVHVPNPAKHIEQRTVRQRNEEVA